MELQKLRFTTGNVPFIFFVLSCLMMVSAFASAQTCESGNDIAPATRNAIQSATAQYFQLAQQGNVSALQQSATPDFSQIGSTVSENKDAFAGTPTLRSIYVLNNSPSPSEGVSSGASKDSRLEFYCGIFNSADSVGFVFPSLPPGQYAVAIQDAKADKSSYSISWILQSSQNRWLIAGCIPRPTTEGGHDGNWFIQQARAYKAKGQTHNAWLYYIMGDSLLRPFPAMSNRQLDKLYDEFSSTRPADIPAGTPVALNLAGKTYQITTMFPAAVGNDIDLVVKYQAADLSNVAKTYDDNVALIKGLLAKYPEFRDAFAGVVARAVASSGQDYGTMLAMKDVK